MLTADIKEDVSIEKATALLCMCTKSLMNTVLLCDRNTHN